MRNALRQIIPSMFHRRLLLLGVLSLGLMGLLAAQTAKLTTGEEHQRRQATLKQHLENATYTPTSRGMIFDRKGRRLAEDRPGWDVQVSFALLSGNWAYDQAEAAARRTMSRQDWRSLTLDQQSELTRQFIEPYLVKIETLKVTLAELGGVDPEAIEARQQEVVRWVQTMGANATAANRRQKYKILTEDQAKNLSWAEVDVPVREEYQPHSVLYDVTPETVTWIDQFIAKAKREDEAFNDAVKKAKSDSQPVPPDTREYDAWLEVSPVRVRQRVYHWETRTFEFDRSTLPGSLANPEPLLVTVDGIGRHIIGTLRPIHKGDPHWDRFPFTRENPDPDGPPIIDLAGYRPNDPIGRFGIERSMESVLRGSRGQRVLHLDTGQETIQPTVAGNDVHLTVDMQLQMRMQAIMSQDPAIGLMRSQPWHNSGYDADQPERRVPAPGDALNGAAIVLDIDNGEVVGAVSVPGISIDDLVNRSVEVFRDFENMPTMFRPVAYRYEPGSTNKPLVLAAAITDGIIGPDETIDCTLGHLWEDNPNTFRDWIYRPPHYTHFGQLTGVEAITVSSNVFFGRIAQKFGEQRSYSRLAEWFSKFGFGRLAGSGLNEEVRGALPPTDSRVSERQAAYMSIGEGAMSATPMQVANAHATLARGGLFIPPTFIQDRSRIGSPRQASSLHLSPAARDRALRGMEASANFRGTSGIDRGTTYWIGFEDGSHERVFDIPGVKVMAKSGTADAPPFRRAFDGGETKSDGSIAQPGEFDRNGTIIREGYHGWVIALVQPEGEPRPTHAIAAVVEYGGSGGRVAGPIVNQIIRALAIEGYLGTTALEAVSPPPVSAETTAGARR